MKDQTNCASEVILVELEITLEASSGLEKYLNK